MCISIIMRASYDSIDNKQKMCEKVNKDITFIQFFHSTRLHSTELFKIFFSLLTLQLLFCKKLVGREIILLVLKGIRVYSIHYTLYTYSIQLSNSTNWGSIVTKNRLEVHLIPISWLNLKGSFVTVTGLIVGGQM